MSSLSAGPVLQVTETTIAGPAVPQVTGVNVVDLADPAETENNNE